MSSKNTFTICGRIHSVTPVVVITRENKAPFSKRIVGVKTEDQQLVFFESRTALQKDLPIDTSVVVDYYFAGSIKGTMNYNNIIATNIKVHEQ